MAKVGSGQQQEALTARQNRRGLFLPPNTAAETKRAFRETHAVAGAVQLAAEHEAGLLQQQVGVAAPVCSLQAGLCLFQEELEAKGSV